MICANGHTTGDDDRFCPICGQPVSGPPVEQDPAPPTTSAVGEGSGELPDPAPSKRGPRRAVLALVLVVVLIGAGAGGFVLLKGGGTNGDSRFLIGSGYTSSSSGLDLYLVEPGTELVDAERIATDASFERIIPIEGPYLEGIEGPIAQGPGVQRIGDRIAVLWWRPGSDVHTSEIVFISDDGTVTSVMREQAPAAQSGPIAAWYSKSTDSLLVQVFGSPTRCYRVGADAVPVLIVTASQCVFTPDGRVWSAEPGAMNSTATPGRNTFAVSLHDQDGELLSKSTIAGVSYVNPNGTGERTFASTPAEFRIYETQSGGLIAQASGLRGARQIAQSRASNVASYTVDNDDEKLNTVIVRGDGSTIDLGMFDRVAVDISADGSTAFVSSSPRVSSSSSSSSSSTSTVTVKVERVDIASGRRDTVATGVDLRTQILGWDDEVVVIWGPDVDRMWRGPVDGEIAEADVPMRDKSDVVLVVPTSDIVVLAGDEGSARADLLTGDGSLLPLTSGWDWVYVGAASPKGDRLTLIGTRDDNASLLGWSKEDGSTEIDSGSSLAVSSMSDRTVVYQRNSGTSRSPNYQVRSASFDGDEPTTIWPNARVLSDPGDAYTVDAISSDLMSGFQTPYVDPVAARCKARGEPVLRPGGTAVGTIGSTDVCIIVTESTALVRLTVVSGTDTTMSVTNSSGSRVAYDDDSGESMEPEIRATLPKGTYVVSVDPYAGSARYGGSFTFRYN